MSTPIAGPKILLIENNEKVANEIRAALVAPVEGAFAVEWVRKLGHGL
jgi:hypothetical protein